MLIGACNGVTVFTSSGKKAEAAEAIEFMVLVDRSGSMKGTSFEQCREGLQELSRRLPANSCMNIIGFGSVACANWNRSVESTGSKEVLDDYAYEMRTDLGDSQLAPALEAVFNMRRGCPAVRNCQLRILVLSDGGFQDAARAVSVLRRYRSVGLFGLGL